MLDLTSEMPVRCSAQRLGRSADCQQFEPKGSTFFLFVPFVDKKAFNVNSSNQ